MNGSGRDFRRLVRALGARLGQASLADAAVEQGRPTTFWRDASDGGSEVACSLLVSGAYAGFTHEGVATLAARLAHDVTAASAALPCPHRLSLFGHSLGGVVARAALPAICHDVDARGLPLEPFALYAMSSPHLGVRRPHGGRTPQVRPAPAAPRIAPPPTQRSPRGAGSVSRRGAWYSGQLVRPHGQGAVAGGPRRARAPAPVGGARPARPSPRQRPPALSQAHPHLHPPPRPLRA